MTIQQENNSERGRFFLEKDGKTLAEMIYVWKQELMVIEHTEVDASLAGQGVGKQLVNAAVDYARAHHIRIVPVCSYAKKVLERGSEYADVLKH
ncbi:MAG: N-acetyltransferase [Bacteroidetes bacterium]|nr:N-acetyltransferase [Bacteroidota bacterium]MBS1628597.1 N-acetyltransferase [Bacteroidota bacterium]